MEPFYLLAELAIGVTGFAGVVVALLARGNQLPLSARIRVGAMLSTAILATLLALIPIGLDAADISLSSIWSTSSLIGTVLIVLNFSVLVAIGIRVPEENQKDGGMANPAAIVGVILAILVCLLLVANSVAYQSSWPLFFGIVILLFWCLILFLREVTIHARGPS